MIAEMCVVVIDKGLEVVYFDDLTTILIILDEGVKPLRFQAMLRQEFLDVLVVKQILLCQS